MKKIPFYTCFVILLAGCSKYLDQLPDNRANLNTPEKVSELLVTAYPQANYATFCEAMSDNVSDIGFGVAGNANSDAYFWNDVRATDQDSPEYYWNACYKAIAAANQALDAIAKAPDPQSYQGQKGEALVARAYAHFMLVSLFSKTYNAATASSDLGIPYVTEPETVVIKQYERKTVQYVYDQVEKDLLEGLPLINEKGYSIPRYHFTQRAAHAFAARFYLYKREYNKVIDHATAVFPAGNWNDNMRTWLGALGTISASTAICQEFTSPTLNANLLLCNTTSWWSRYCTAYRYATSAAISNQLKAANVTTGTYAFRWFSWSSGTYWAIPKYAEYFVYTTATSGKGYNMVPLFVTEEVLLNRAEAYTKTGQYALAIGDLNTWAKGRIASYSVAKHEITEDGIKTFYKTASLDTGLVKTILDTRRVEFVGEGLRWFDLLRYDQEVVHRSVNGHLDTLAAGALKRVIQVPQEASAMSGLPLNPR
jgi:hypothetical protein